MDTYFLKVFDIIFLCDQNVEFAFPMLHLLLWDCGC